MTALYLNGLDLSLLSWLKSNSTCTCFKSVQGDDILSCSFVCISIELLIGSSILQMRFHKPSDSATEVFGQIIF